MKRLSLGLIFLFLLTGVAVAAPTMAGRIKSYDGSKGILVLERDDKSVRTFKVTDKTVCEYMGRTTHPGALRVGSKISIQIAGALNNDPLKAAKIVDWGSSNKIVAKGAKAPYHTKVSQFASSNGGGGIPEGAPVGVHSASHTLGAVGHGGSENAPNPASHPNSPVAPMGDPHASPAANPHHMGQAGPTVYQNQGQTTMSPLHLMNTNPVFSPGAGQMGTLMGEDDTGSDMGMMGVNSSYGASGTKMTGRVLQVQQNVVMLQSFEHPQVQRVIIGMSASVSPDLLIPGQMVEVYGSETPQGFQATQIKPANGF